MAKYSNETKRELIRLVEEQNHSIGSAAEELGVEKSVAKRWMRMYEFHGYEGLTKKSGSYSGEFKISVVEYMHKNHLSIQEASAMYGIPLHSTLLNWEQIYYREGASGLMTSKRGCPKKIEINKDKDEIGSKKTEEDLIAEIRRLRAENAYLKKYNALVQEKTNLEAKRKRK